MASERYAIINISGHAVVVTCLRTPKKASILVRFSVLPVIFCLAEGLMIIFF